MSPDEDFRKQGAFNHQKNVIFELNMLENLEIEMHDDFSSFFKVLPPPPLQIYHS